LFYHLDTEFTTLARAAMRSPETPKELIGVPPGRASLVMRCGFGYLGVFAS
jgi:hypothetical protein